MRAVLVFLLLTVTIITSGQINIICPKLIDSTLNYFYIGVDNPMEIVGFKMTPAHKISISGQGTTVFGKNESTYTPGNSITRINENRYIVRTRTPSDSCFIVIYKGKKEVFRKRFISATIADPYVTIANKIGLQDITMSKDSLLKIPFLSTSIKNFYLKDYYYIVSFDMTFDAENDSIINTSAKGNQLTEEQIGLIKNLKSGMMVTVENIRARAWDGRTRKLFPFWFKIE